MQRKQLSCVYYPEVDRFLVSQQGKKVGKQNLIQSSWYLSLEYFRYIPENEIEFKDIDRFLEKYPQELCCEITNACNFSCPICVADSKVENQNHMCKKLYTKAIEDKPITIKRINLTGGEPTLNPCLPEMLAEASNAARGVILSTNGFLPNMLENALQKNSGIIVAISMHGSKAEHDSFVKCKNAYEKALESIQVASNYVDTIQIHTTIIPQTLKGLAKLCETLAGLPIKEHRLNMIKPYGRLLVDGVPYEVITKLLSNIEVPYKISVKKNDQPFMFISCEGKKEIRHVRRC